MPDVVEVPLDGSEVAGTGDPDAHQPKPKPIPHLTPEERVARGKAARACGAPIRTRRMGAGPRSA